MYSPIQIDKYTSVKLDYHPKYGMSLQEGREYEGEFKPSFVKAKFGKKGEEVEKVIPKNIKLGDSAHAIEVLEALLWQLKNDGETTPF